MRRIYRNLRNRTLLQWRRFWVERAGASGLGRLAAWLASRHAAPFHQRAYLSDLSPRGFVAPGASVTHPDLRMGKHIYLGDGVVVHRTNEGGPVELADRVQIYGNTFIETGMGGRIRIDEGTHIQPGCHIHAYLSEVRIGKMVEIAPNCGFYCYDHGMAPGIPIMEQQLRSKGNISVGDGAWIGYGVTVLQGVRIGEGAVVAAGAVVAHDVHDHAIVGGVPARVIGSRLDTV